MTVPLVVLAFFAAVAGFINLPFSGSTKWLEDWLAPVTGRYGAELTYSNAHDRAAARPSRPIVALTGIGLAYLVYLRKRIPAEPFEPPLFANGWYYDIAVTAFMGGPGRRFADGLAWFDRDRHRRRRQRHRRGRPRLGQHRSGGSRTATCAPTRWA